MKRRNALGTLVFGFLAATGCGQAPPDEVEARFEALTSAASPAESLSINDEATCIDAFHGGSALLARWAERRDLSDAQIAEFCDQLAELQRTYESTETMTIAALLGTFSRAGARTYGAYAVYHVEQLRDWYDEAHSQKRIRGCLSEAWQNRGNPEFVWRDHMRNCTGLPGPVHTNAFLEGNLSTFGALGGGLAFAMYRDPDGNRAVAAFAVGYIADQSGAAVVAGCGYIDHPERGVDRPTCIGWDLGVY
jgi:hypothetical protein